MEPRTLSPHVARVESSRVRVDGLASCKAMIPFDAGAL